MRVGVHFGYARPESGGEFTFQRAVSQALAQVAAESRHSFVLFGSASIVMPAASDVEIPLRRRTLLGRAHGRLHRVVSEVGRGLRGRESPAPDYLEAKFLREGGVDVVWYVGQF